MPRILVWACRVFGYAWSLALCWSAAAHARDAGGVHALLVGYAVIGAAMAVWAAMELRTGATTLPPVQLAWVLAVICGTAGALCATHEGTLSVLPAGIAALVAGGDCATVPALAVGGAGVLGVMAGAIGSDNSQTALLVGLPACIISGLLLGRHRRAYRVQAAQAVELLERTRELQVQQRRAEVLDERTRIAREIHDVLAHSLGSLSIQIQAARAVLADGGDPDTVLDVLADAQRLATGGLAETRRALHALRADAFSLERELRQLADGHHHRHRTEVDVEVEGEQGELDPAAAMTLLRVAQEALVNAAKHAPGRPIALSLVNGEERVRLTTVNPLGAGPPGPQTAAPSTGTESTAVPSAAAVPPAALSPSAVSPAAVSPAALSTADSGYGLTGMRERLLLSGGTLYAGPRGRNWIVEAELPRTAPPPPSDIAVPASASPAAHQPSPPSPPPPSSSVPSLTEGFTA